MPDLYPNNPLCTQLIKSSEFKLEQWRHLTNQNVGYLHCESVAAAAAAGVGDSLPSSSSRNLCVS